ncbi:hypothetical protein F7725_011838 [Dissostichus mawsoni]|uniref:L27 domain-containing protein n=1 Tax=Dissostichus mawsoni TaxID=36200 RepID=A0A7J5ZD45_DISMA|nr:hypothetical protein F7725_011838 [Dissostichus mawsoni]
MSRGKLFAGILTGSFCRCSLKQMKQKSDENAEPNRKQRWVQSVAGYQVQELCSLVYVFCCSCRRVQTAIFSDVWNRIHERLKRFEKRSPIPVQEHAASLASELAEELTNQGWTDEIKELVGLFSQPDFKSPVCHDAVAQRTFEPTLPPIPDTVLEDDEDSVKIVSLVKTKDPLGATIKMDKSTGTIVVARIMRRCS